MSARILVVDDEPPIRRLLRTTLQANDYEVIEASTAAYAVKLANSEKPDVVILDLGLPDRDGMELIAEIRTKASTPIIVLSVRNDEKGKVAALDAGADDYVTKPFGAGELVARVRTALRHRVQQQGATPIFKCGAISVDLVRRRVRRGEDEVKLSPKEYEILAELVIHAGKVLTHKHLLQAVWGDSSDADVQYLRVFVRQLRQKLEADPARPNLIQTESGVGYRLKSEEDERAS